jgi:hypothetical protein
LPNIHSFILLLAVAAAAPSQAAATTRAAKPVVQALPRESHAPAWYQDPKLTKSFLAGLTREIAQIRFGARWPDAVPERSGCDSYVGELDDLFQIRNWVYACDSRREGATRTDYMYLLGEDETPTLERVRYAIVAPPDARPEDWGKIQTTLLDDLSAALEIPKWRDRDWEKIGMGRDRVVAAKLFTTLPDTGKAAAPSRTFTILRFPVADTTGGWGYNRNQGEVREEMRPMEGSETPKISQPAEAPRRTKATVDSLIVYCFSARLEAETHEANWDIEHDTTAIGIPVAVEYGRSDVIHALRKRWPELAKALDSTRAIPDQIYVVDSAVSMAHRLPAGSERDLVLYAAHLWTNGVLGDLQGNPPSDCNGVDNAFVQKFNAAFTTRDRSRISCDHYGAWWYSGGFIDSVVTHAGKSPWADYAFLDRTSAGWELEYGCGSEIGSDQFRPVIARGEAFLKTYSSFLVAPEVRLLVAEAHETAWSLGKMFPGDRYIDSTVYATEAPNHRSRAIALYEKQLRERPSDSRNAGIRKRLARMRLDVDTGYREFWCSNE